MPALKAMGTRRRCLSCASAFYDLDRTPILCASCGVEFTVVEYARRPEPARRHAAYVRPKPIVEDEAPEAKADDTLLVEDEDEAQSPDEEEDEDADAEMA
jgi:uncharacterized protein (TIGR02300 family)